MEPASLTCRCEWSVFTCYSRKRLQESGSYWQKLKYNFSCGSLKRGKGEDTNWDTHLFGREFIQALAKIIPNRLRWFGWKVLEFSMVLKESKILLSSWKAIDSRFQSFRSDVVCKLEIEKAYENVQRNFLSLWTERMDSEQRWDCLDQIHLTVRFSILVDRRSLRFLVIMPQVHKRKTKLL